MLSLNIFFSFHLEFSFCDNVLGHNIDNCVDHMKTISLYHYLIQLFNHGDHKKPVVLKVKTWLKMILQAIILLCHHD